MPCRGRIWGEDHGTLPEGSPRSGPRAQLAGAKIREWWYGKKGGGKRRKYHKREVNDMYEELTMQAKAVTEELCDRAKLGKGQILVVGCSTSEVCGSRIGSNSNLEAAEAVFAGIYEVTKARGIYLAAQCCEHLNRAIIIEAEAVPGQPIVNAVPQPKAGGSFATTAYKTFAHPVALEEIKADAGLDIGDTLIGMHLKAVAVPVRLEHHTIGEAHIVAARVRPKYIGGIRAQYDENLG